MYDMNYVLYITYCKKIKSMVLENWSDLGIVIEISGFILLLIFWKVPTYSDLFRWKRTQILYKLIFGYEKYAKRISDNKAMDDDDTITRSTGLAVNSDNKVPLSFLRFWKSMRIFSILVVISGLLLQFSLINPST